MATLHISLSEQLKEFVRDDTENGGFSNYSDYIRYLIRERRKKSEKKRKQDVTKNISNDLVHFMQTLSLFSDDTESLKKMITTYTLAEAKKKNPIPVQDFIKNTQKISDTASCKGLTPKILNDIINEK